MDDKLRAFYQQNFYAYYLYMSGFHETTNWWERDFCNFCQDFYIHVLAGKRPIYYIEAPVQHGKSRKKRFFLTWLVGRHKDLRFNFYTGDDSLRKETSDFMLSAFEDEKFHEIFGKVIKKGGTQNIDTMQFSEGGQVDYRLLGSGGVGFPSHFSLIDDPYSKDEQARSEIQKETVLRRFQSGVISRRQEMSGVLLTHSRWYVDDLIGTLKASVKAGGFKGITIKGFSYPAIAIEDEKYRKQGEALFPQLRSIEFLQEQRSIFNETKSSALFEALYQQSPVVEGGNLFKLDWLHFTDTLPEKFDYRFITSDTAYKEGQQNDFTVFAYWGVKLEDGRPTLYLIDMRRKKIPAVDIENWIDPWIAEKITYGFRYAWIEDKGHGIYLNQKFRARGYPIPPEEMIKETLPRDRDKVERAHNIIASIDKIRKNVYVRSGIECIEDFKSELIQFPNGKHDDTVDVFIDACKIALTKEDIVQKYKLLYS